MNDNIISTQKMKKLTLVALFFLFIGNVFASEHHEAASQEEFNPTEMIMHHIGDSHEFHLWGDVTMPLPIILYSEKGFDFFLSSEFHHGEKSVITSKGEYMIHHEKIYFAENGVLNYDEHHHPLNAKPIDLSITKNVFSMAMSAIILFLIFLSVAKAYSKKGQAAPSGLQNMMEVLIIFVRDEIAIPNIGEKKYGKFMPYLLSVFFFIWINNLIGLVPFFPGGSNLTGNIAFTVTMALFTFIITNLNGNKSYWGHIFAMPGVPKPLLIILAPIEVIGLFTKPFALTVRLFANITAGHIIILSLFSLIFIFKNAAWAGLSVPMALFMSVLELLVAFLQAFVFTLLSALFIGAAVADHDHDHEHEAHENHAH